MPLTTRSQLLNQLLPAVKSGVRKAGLRGHHAEEAVQQSLAALASHLEEMTCKTEAAREGYAFIVGSRAALRLRKRIASEARVTDDEGKHWDRLAVERSVTPEQLLGTAERMHKANQTLHALAPRDQRIVAAIHEDGLSERDVARELGMTRSNIAYRVRMMRRALAQAWSDTTSWVRKHGD